MFGSEKRGDSCWLLGQERGDRGMSGPGQICQKGGRVGSSSNGLDATMTMTHDDDDDYDDPARPPARPQAETGRQNDVTQFLGFLVHLFGVRSAAEFSFTAISPSNSLHEPAAVLPPHFSENIRQHIATYPCY